MVEIGTLIIHFVYPKVEEDELHRIGSLLFQIAEDGVRKFISIDANVVLDLEDGTLKARTKVFLRNAAVALLMYGGLRQAADYLANDLNKAGNFIFRKTEDRLGVPSSNVITRRRYATLNQKIKRIFEDVENRRITPDQAMDALVKILDLDSEGGVPPEVIEELQKEVRAAHQIAPLQPTPPARTRAVRPRFPRQEHPVLRERPLKPRRVRIQRIDGQIMIDEVD
jgi:hypothetical protein